MFYRIMEDVFKIIIYMFIFYIIVFYTIYSHMYVLHAQIYQYISENKDVCQWVIASMLPCMNIYINIL